VPRIDGSHLRKYREVCGFSGDDVPVTYPHLLASGLHLGMLTSAQFPVRLLGLVHVGNRIEQLAPLRHDAAGQLAAWLEGHRETERGQEFDLFTEFRAGGQLSWREQTTFLARRKRASATKAPLTERPVFSGPAVTVRAPAGLGRRYGRIAFDWNPIHLSDVTARLFGFPRAIAHGMWSLARCAAELGARGPGVLDVHFKLPLLLPSSPVLERDAGGAFRLLDEHREKPHLEGTWAPTSPRSSPVAARG
jgi:MaoC like domain